MTKEEKQALEKLYNFWEHLSEDELKNVDRMLWKPFLSELAVILPRLGYSLEKLKQKDAETKAIAKNLLGLKLGREDPSPLLIQKVRETGLASNDDIYKNLIAPFPSLRS